MSVEYYSRISYLEVIIRKYIIVKQPLFIYQEQKNWALVLANTIHCAYNGSTSGDVRGWHNIEKTLFQPMMSCKTKKQ